jgi:hypothetical protein
VTEDERQILIDITELKTAFVDAVDAIGARYESGGSHELTIAKTKIEEAAMWVAKDIMG